MALETRLRAEEAYYDMSKITDKLYAQSKNGNNFYKLYELIISEDNILLAYRNIKRNTGSNTKGTDGKTVKDYLKRNNYTTYKIGKVVLIPMVYISHRKPMNFSQDMNVYTEEGRNKSGYKKLVLEGALKERWRVRNKYDDVEFLDNSISKISAQQLTCAISKLFVTDGEIHHIKPKENGGDNSYDNLLYVDKNVHKLIHLKDEGKIQIYLSHFEKIVSDYNDFINTLNKFRKLARNKIINLSK